MEPAIATGCVSSERIAEAVHLGVRSGVRGFLVHANQWLADSDESTAPEINFTGADFFGFYDALSGSGNSLFGAESQRSYGCKRLRVLCEDAHRQGGRLIILGGLGAREMEVRASTSEIHARLADFFDGVIPVFESRRITLVLDVPEVRDDATRLCLSGVGEITRFLGHYRHPLLRIGLRASELEMQSFSDETFLEKILPQLSVVIFDNLLPPHKGAMQTITRLVRYGYKGIVLLGIGNRTSEGINGLSRELERFKELIQA
jgi:hypothetical protein